MKQFCALKTQFLAPLAATLAGRFIDFEVAQGVDPVWPEREAYYSRTAVYSSSFFLPYAYSRLYSVESHIRYRHAFVLRIASRQVE